MIEGDLHLLIKILTEKDLPLSEYFFEIFKHFIHLALLLLLLSDILDLDVIEPPHNSFALVLSHIKIFFEVFLNINLICLCLEYLYLQSHKIVSECLEDNIDKALC